MPTVAITLFLAQHTGSGYIVSVKRSDLRTDCMVVISGIDGVFQTLTCAFAVPYEIITSA